MEVEPKQKKMEAFIYRINVVVDSSKGREIVESVDDPVVDMDKVVGKAVIISSTDAETIEDYKAKIWEDVGKEVEVLIEVEVPENNQRVVKLQTTDAN